MGFWPGGLGWKYSYPGFLPSTQQTLQACLLTVPKSPLFFLHAPSFPFLSHVRVAVGFAH